jgi:hypothetical protein
MSLWNKFVELFDKDSQQFVAVPLGSERVDTKPDPVPIEAGKTYFRLRLSQMFLQKEVWAAKTWYPAVHSLVKFDFGNQQGVEIPNIADPAISGISDGQGNVVVSNLVLTPTVPFSGGTVAISAGLVAIASSNRLNDFIGVFAKFGDLLAVPQLSGALKIAQPLALGIQGLFSSNSSTLHLGWKQQFAGGELRRGYVVVLRSTEANISPSRLWIIKDQLREGATQKDNAPFSRCDFMLLRFDVFEDRDDWDKLTYIDDPYQQALDALQDGSDDSVKKADYFMQTALRKVYKSQDLTQADRVRVTFALKDRYQQAQTSLGQAGLIGEDLSLARVMRGAMSPDAALLRAEPTDADIFDLA